MACPHFLSDCSSTFFSKRIFSLCKGVIMFFYVISFLFCEFVLFIPKILLAILDFLGEHFPDNFSTSFLFADFC